MLRHIVKQPREAIMKRLMHGVALSAAAAILSMTSAWLVGESAALGTRTVGEPWILDSNNWQQAQGLLPDVVLNRVKSGEYWYKVQPIDPDKFKQNYSKKFWDASEGNAGKFDVDPATCGLKDV